MLLMGFSGISYLQQGSYEQRARQKSTGGFSHFSALVAGTVLKVLGKPNLFHKHIFDEDHLNHI